MFSSEKIFYLGLAFEILHLLSGYNLKKNQQTVMYMYQELLILWYKH